MNKDYLITTPQIVELSKMCEKNSIEPSLYSRFEVKRGLRDINGEGVLTGLTEVSTIVSSKMVDGKKIPCNGELYYRGINVNDLVDGFINDDRFGFEETVYLLIFGKLPNKEELRGFNDLLTSQRKLPTHFVRDVVLKAANADIMNSMARGVLTLYTYDENANDLSIPNVLRQCLYLISIFPQLAVYSYQAYSYYLDGQSLFIHLPNPELSTAENILSLLRPDSKYTKLEAKILDLALILHAEHGGGNNSTFTTHVVSSSGTDTYSSSAASLCSLKGPKHGGANIKVVEMFEDIRKNVSDWNDDEEIKQYIYKILNKEAFDKSGLVYGIGHAVYSESDPRANIFEKFVKPLSDEKGRKDEFQLYQNVARIAVDIIKHERKIYKGVSPNIDFYSGFVYSMLDLPKELFTPIFAIARIAGWSAHRIEELTSAGKIIRPAYKGVKETEKYIPLDKRK